MKTYIAHIIIPILTSILMLGEIAMSQDPQLSQFYASPLYINPALTGNTEQLRVIGNWRKQWLSVPGAFKTYALSTDYNIKKIKSGVGIQLMRDKAGSGDLRFTNIAGLYSYQIDLTRLHHVKAGLKASYTIRDVDFSRFVFGDQLVRNDGSGTNETFASGKKSFPDFSTGIVYYYSNRGWIGSAIHHLTRPDESLVGIETRLPMQFTAHGGYHIALKRDVKKHIVESLIPVINYKQQQDWDQLDAGMYYQKSIMMIGLWYRGIPMLKAYKPGYSNHDALIAMAAIKAGNFRFGYSYDFTVSKLFGDTRGAHEISIIYEYAEPEYKKLKGSFIVPCAKF